jgi:Fe-S-cluster containining protein
MDALVKIDTGDRQLLAAIGDSLAEAARRSGEWLACRPGCTPCCLGPFAITQLDAYRLQKGLRELHSADPARAAAVRSRAEAYVEMVAPEYPGDPLTGALPDEDALSSSLDEIPCPALDPATGCCDLYAARPITCRTFGPVTRNKEGILGPCELCYSGATNRQMLDCAVEFDPAGLEDALLAEFETPLLGGMTIVAYALAPFVNTTVP